MAKKLTKKVKRTANVTVKDCWVKLKRLSQTEIEQYLKPNNITHNIRGMVNGSTLKIGDLTVKSKDLVFNVQMKLQEGGITIAKSQSPIPSSCSKTSKKMTQKHKQTSCLTIAVPQPKPIVKLIDEAWRKCKLDRQGKFEMNDLVMAKLKGHPAWPAKIVEFVNKTKVKVIFLGANQNEKFGFVSITEIVHFGESGNVIRLTLKRDFIHSGKFKKGIQEAEVLSGIPPNASILIK